MSHKKLLENVRTLWGRACMSKLIQPVSWQTEMGARRRHLCPLCSLSPGCQGKACLSTCCLSHGEAAPGEGMSVKCGYICMDYAFTLKSWDEFLAYISADHAWPLPEATSTTVIKIFASCGQPAVPWSVAASKLLCMLQLQSPPLRVTPSATECMSSIFVILKFNRAH